MNLEEHNRARNSYCHILDLPIEMIRKILTYLSGDDLFFWSYGLVCKSFLYEAASIMKEKRTSIKLFDGVSFETHLRLICHDNYISCIVNEVGLDLSNNKFINRQNLELIFDSCNKVKVLDLSFCELKNNSFENVSSNLSDLRQLNLSGCTGLTDEDLACLVKSCIQLRHLSLLMCGNISDAGNQNIFLSLYYFTYTLLIL